MARGSSGTSSSGGGGGAVTSVAGKTGVVSLVKGDVGLANVDNTADTAKPVSTAAQTALDAKAPLASPTFTGTVSGVSKAAVGLGNVDNTADASKPISTAQAAVNATLAPLASPTFTGTVSGVSKAAVGLGNVDNTSDVNKPVSTAQTTAIAASQTAGALKTRGLGIVPRIGSSIAGQNFIGGTTAATPTFKQTQFVPFVTGPVNWTSDAILLNVSTAFTGDTATSLLVSLFPDDGTGFPNAAAGPLVTATVSWTTMTTTGIKTQVWDNSATQVLQPGLYWLAVLLTGTTAPTAGQFTVMSNNTYALGMTSGITPGTSIRAYGLNTQTAMPTTQPTDASFVAVGSSVVPVVQLRRSA